MAKTGSNFRLQLLHAADQEAGLPALEDAPRFSAVLNALRNQDLDGDGVAGFGNTLTLSSGDAILPGVFFNASETAYGAKGVADILIQNALGFQAIAFGNHEFDLGPELMAGLIGGDAAEGFDGAQFPYLSTNLNFSGSAEFADLVVPGGAAPMEGKVSSSAVFTVNGEKIGVIGATTPTLGSISSPGDVSVQPASGDIDDLAALIQEDVDALRGQGVDKVILLAHMQQIALEQALAEKLDGVDIIVAGGSNTRLFDSDDTARPGDSAQGVYPFMATSKSGEPVAVVNTDGNYKYVGRLVIDFDENGVLIPDSYDAAISGAYRTDEAGVAALDAGDLVDPKVQEVVDTLKSALGAAATNVLGYTDVFLNGARGSVRIQETNLGDLTADANLAEARKTDPSVVLSLKNGGGIRDSIGSIGTPPGALEPQPLPPEDGKITQLDIEATLRFNNGLTLITLTAEELLAVLEHGFAASSADDGNTQGRFPQLAGVEVAFDLSRAPGDRIVSAALVDENGAATRALVVDGELAVAADEEFRIVTLGFLGNARFDDDGNFIGGGDGYPFPNTNADPEKGALGDAAVVARANLLNLAQDDDADRTGAATFAADGSEQDALAEYLRAAHGADNPFDQEDAGRAQDERLQNLAYRDDAVFDGLPERKTVINAVLGSTTGADSEYVELFGEAGASLDGRSLIIVGGDNGVDAGEIERRIDFGPEDRIGDNGFFLIANGQAEERFGVTADMTVADNYIENSAYTVALVETASLDGATVAGGEQVLDAVAFDDNKGDNTYYFDAPVLGPQDGKYLPAGARRMVDGQDADAAGDWSLLDYGDDPKINTPTAGAGDGGGAGVGSGSIDDQPTLISAVQGDQDAAAKVGETVVVEAIVTGDFQNGDADAFRNLGGFFVMEEAADRDDDARTSEGVFIDSSDLSIDVNEGDKVRVLGEVVEKYGRTVIVATGIRVEQAGAETDLDAFAVVSKLPGADAREAVESMLIRFDETFTFTESFDVEQFGEITLSTIGEIQQFSQINTPDAAGYAAHVAMVADKTILLDDGTDGRREDGAAILKPDGAAYTVDEGLRMGQTTQITGIMDYGFGEDRIRLPGFETFETDKDANPRPEAPDEVGGSLKVASYNVLNYFTTLNARGAESGEELDRQAEKLVTSFLGMDADVIGLVELENNGAAIRDLVAKINARFDDRIYAAVELGGKVGSDAITNGVIYDMSKVEMIGEAAILDSDDFLDPLGAGRDLNRPAIAATFREKATGGEFTMVVNHLKSKGSASGLAADEDQGDGAGRNNATREAAAKELAAWLETNPTGSDDEDVLIVGDLNSYAREDPIVALEALGYVNAKAPGGSVEELSQHSYRFSGQIGTLDYVMASESAARQISGATTWNINSDEMFIFDYNKNATFNSGDPDRPTDQALFDGENPAKNSDHDPVVIGLNLENDADTLLLVESGSRGGMLVGSDANEQFVVRGGRARIDTGAGEDVVAISDTPGRAMVVVADFDADKDDIALAEGLHLRAVDERGGAATALFDNGDRWTFIGLTEDALRAELGADLIA